MKCATANTPPYLYLHDLYTDAEAAFKKLTSAFEKLHDPLQQAASRAEAERPNRQHGRRGNSNSSKSRRTGGAQDRGTDEGGGGACSGEAPRWCREGEYVPEKEKEKEQPPTSGERKVGHIGKELWLLRGAEVAEGNIIFASPGGVVDRI